MSQSNPSPARKIGQVIALALMVFGIIWWIVGGMLQNNQAHGYEAGASTIIGIGLFLALQK